MNVKLTLKYLTLEKEKEKASWKLTPIIFKKKIEDSNLKRNAKMAPLPHLSVNVLKRILSLSTRLMKRL